MVLDYFTSGRFRPVSGRAWFLGDGLSPQAGDLVIPGHSARRPLSHL